MVLYCNYMIWGFGEICFLIGYHGGATWDIDPSWDSQFVVTACADANARLFEATTGNYIARMPHKGYDSVLLLLLFVISFVSKRRAFSKVG